VKVRLVAIFYGCAACLATCTLYCTANLVAELGDYIQLSYIVQLARLGCHSTQQSRPR
jgi:hypothetical protein